MTNKFCALLVCFMLFANGLLVKAQIKLPAIFSDGMVLQRNANVAVFGKAEASQRVNVTFNGSVYKTKSDKLGNWIVKIKTDNAGGPHVLRVLSNKNEVVVNDILLGDVWLLSGQSNMELPMRRVKPLYEQVIAQANNNNIRYFDVPKTYHFKEPKNNFDAGNWVPVSSESINEISALAYFYATELNKIYNVPIGIILSAVGGSPAEAWLSEGALKGFPSHHSELMQYKNDQFIIDLENSEKQRANKWYSDANANDVGYTNGFKKLDYDFSNWDSFTIPGLWEEKIGRVNGAFWFRKNVELTQKHADKPAFIELGVIVDADSVFVNGVLVGNTSYQYPPRRYSIPAGVLKAGTNNIVVRVINERGAGGFVADKKYELIVDGDVFNLSGQWHYKLGAKMEALPYQTFVRWKPAGLFNAMIAPLKDFTIKGAVWYQGESNTDNPSEYARLLPALISDWRGFLNSGDFPFIVVQLPGFMQSHQYPTDSNWARLREAQANAARNVENTALAVAIDLGEWNDIHPLNKKDVALRVALAARKLVYNDTICGFSPLYGGVEFDDGKAVISFNNVCNGLVAVDGNLKHFAIAGDDMKFVWANAKIVNNKVVVWSDDVKAPVAVRYAWADFPHGANLFNSQGLPVAPFRTDSE
jgi:sialate O-acetylesterase